MKILHAIENFLRKKSKKAFLIVLGLFFIPGLLLAKKLPPGWILDATVNGVEFYHLIEECGGKKVVFLKFNNKNTKAVKVLWKEVFTTQDRNVSKLEGPFKEKQFALPPGEILVQDCENTKYNELLARPDQTTPVYKANIIKFSFKNIKVIR